MSFWTTAFILTALFRASWAATDQTTEQLLQDQFVNLTAEDVYDRHVRPYPVPDRPVHVHNRVYVYFIGDVDAQASEFFVQLLVRQRWNDPRLRFNVSDLCIQGEQWHASQMWAPTVYLVNQKQANLIDVSAANVFVSVCPNGDVHYSFRIKATLFCTMDLRRFPFDAPTCSFLLESWLHSTDDLLLVWETDIPYSTSLIKLAEYELSSITVANGSFHFPQQAGVMATYRPVQKTVANYSRLVMNFHLVREPGYYLLDYYIPSGFLVIVSWVSFWLSPDAAPARVTLGTSTMLTLFTLSNTIKNSLPKVSYTKRVDVWLFICTTFIFLSLVEFAFVNTIHRRRKNVELKKKTAKHVLKSTLKPSGSSSRINKSASCGRLDRLAEQARCCGGGGGGVSTVAGHLAPPSPQPELRRRPQQVFFVGGSQDDTVSSINSVSSRPNLSEVSQCFSMDSGLNSAGSATSVLISSLTAGAQAMVQNPPQSPPPVARRPSMFQRPFIEMTPPQIAKWIDTRSRWLFPLCFVATNIGYWVSTAL